MSPWGGKQRAPVSPSTVDLSSRSPTEGADHAKERVRPPRRPAALETALAGPRHLVPDDGMLRYATVLLLQRPWCTN